MFWTHRWIPRRDEAPVFIMENKGEKNQKRLEGVKQKVTFFESVSSPALLTQVTQRCDGTHKTWNFIPGVATITVGKTNSSTSWQLNKITVKSYQKLIEMFFVTTYTDRTYALMKDCLPVCRSTTKWQVVASSDPIIDTQSVIGTTKKKTNKQNKMMMINIEQHLIVTTVW